MHPIPEAAIKHDGSVEATNALASQQAASQQAMAAMSLFLGLKRAGHAPHLGAFAFPDMFLGGQFGAPPPSAMLNQAAPPPVHVPQNHPQHHHQPQNPQQHHHQHQLHHHQSPQHQHQHQHQGPPPPQQLAGFPRLPPGAPFLPHQLMGVPPARRKNATKESTAPLKFWLSNNREHPYPNKNDKVFLAVLSSMTLTQVSTWFANARRRLKKEKRAGAWLSPSGRDEFDDLDDDELDDEENGAENEETRDEDDHDHHEKTDRGERAGRGARDDADDASSVVSASSNSYLGASQKELRADSDAHPQQQQQSPAPGDQPKGCRRGHRGALKRKLVDRDNDLEIRHDLAHNHNHEHDLDEGQYCNSSSAASSTTTEATDSEATEYEHPAPKPTSHQQKQQQHLAKRRRRHAPAEPLSPNSGALWRPYA